MTNPLPADGLHKLTGEFGTLICALEATGLDEFLDPDFKQPKDSKTSGGLLAGWRKDAPKKLTVFAPTDSAFAMLPTDTLLYECVQAARNPVDPVGRWRSGSVVCDGDGQLLDLYTGKPVSDDLKAKFYRQATLMECLRASLMGLLSNEEKTL
jgi:hypothetical protein